MNDFRDKMEELLLMVWPLLLVLSISCLAVLASGCKSSHDIPVVHDTTYVNKIEYRDRLIHDSVFNDRYHTIYTTGDTVYIHDSVSYNKWKIVHDSVYLHDTIYRYKDNPVEVVVYKNKYHWWLPILVLIVFGFGVAYWYLKKGKK